MSDSTVQVTIIGSADGLNAAMQQASESVRENTEAMRQQFEGVGNSLDDLSSQMSTALSAAGVFVLIEAFEKLSATMQEAFSHAIEISNMSDVLGVTTGEFQAMGAAAEAAGVSQEKLFRGTERLVVMMNEARDGSGKAIDKLLELGLTMQQITDPGFTTAQMLQALSGRLQDASTHFETMSALAKDFGPRAALVAKAIEEMGSKAADWDKWAQGINALTETQIEKLKDAHKTWAELGEGIANTTAKLISFFDVSEEEGKRAIGTSAELLELQKQLQAEYDKGRGRTPAQGGGADAKIAEGHKVAAAAIADEQVVTLAQLDAVHESISIYKEGTAGRLAILQAYADLARQHYGGDEVDEVRKANAAVLEEERKQGDARAHQKEEENRKREEAAVKANEALRRLDALELADVQRIVTESGKFLDEQTKMVADAVKSREALGLEDIKIKEEQLVTQEKLGKISQQQELAGELQLENQKYALALKAAQDRIALYALDDKERQKSLEALELLEKKHALAIAKIQDKAALDAHKPWDNFFHSLDQGFANVLGKLFQGTATFGHAMQSMFANVEQALAQSVAKNIASMLTQDAASKDIHLKQVVTDAKGAAAGAYNAIAGIPYVGPFLAPIAAATAFTGVMAFSAEGGFDIPAGMNPVTQLHAQEMVLPAPLANVVRDMAGRGNGGGNPTFNFNGSHVGNQYMMDKDRLADAMQAIWRSGRSFT